MLHFKMWWGIAAVVAVTWLFGLTHATLEMWMEPEDKKVYPVEEGGSKSIECVVLIDTGVTVNLTWSGPSIDASKPQHVSNDPQEKYDRVGNWLNITNFSNATAGEYKCRAITSASPPNDLTRSITLVKECDNDRFNPPSCNKNCSTYCNPGPCEAKGRNCDLINGTCLSGCQEGYKMPDCTEKSDDPGHEVNCSITVIVIAAIGVLGIIIFSVLVMRERRPNYFFLRNILQRQNDFDRMRRNELERTRGNEFDRMSSLSRDVAEEEQEENWDMFDSFGNTRQREREQGLKDQINQLTEKKRQMEQDKEKTDGEIAILNAKIVEEEQNKRRLENQILEHEKAKKEMEALKKEGMEMTTELKKVTEEKKNLQQEKEMLMREKAFFERRLQQEMFTKTEKLQQLSQEQEAQVKNLTQEIIQKNEEKVRADKDIDTLQRLSQKHKAQVKKLTDEINQKNEEIERADKYIEKLHEERQEQEIKVKKLTEEINHKDKEKERADKEIEKLHKERQEQEIEVKKLTEEINQKDKEKERADKEIEKLQELSQKQDEEVKKLTEEINQKNKEKERADKDFENLQKLSQKQEAQVKKLIEEINEKKGEKVRADKDFEKLQELYQKQKALVKKLTEEINKNNKEKEKADKDIENFHEMKKKDDQNRTDTENLKTQIDGVIKENTNLREEVTHLMTVPTNLPQMEERKPEDKAEDVLTQSGNQSELQEQKTTLEEGTGAVSKKDNHPESQCRSVRSSKDEMTNEAIAERVRTSLGNHEAEVSLTGEDGLHQCLINCLKNPGHQNFIPINEFNMEHLPSHYHDKLIVDYVRATSDVTCRLSVLHISEDRPKLLLGSDQPSPFSIQKGEKSMLTGVTEDRPESCPDNDQASLLSIDQEHNFLMTGTGWVSDVIKYSLTDNICCECEECQSTQTPKKTWGVVYLRTACHVVHNNEEAKHTKCQFFFDSYDTDINKVRTLRGLQVVGSDIKRDLCWMMYVTHDVELLEKFYKMFIRLRDLHHKVITKYRYLLKSSDAVCNTNVKHDLCIIVSYPHGCSKTVAVGKWTQKHLVRKDGSGNEEIKYSYDTATCRGSGGAPVITLVDDMKLQYGLSHPRAHCQGPSGGQEAKMNSTKEVAVNKAIILCEKNPGHQNFICVQDFNIKHLPTRYSDIFIVNYVEGMSGLTCRLTVSDISKDRPDILPGSEQVTSGTGWAMSVVKFTDGENGNCPCKECCKTEADTPKKTTWGVIYLKTASHVVSDEAARDTKFHFFYDSHEATLTTVPTLTGSEVKDRSIDGDSCVMISVTHDVNLLDTLYKKSLEWQEQRSKVHFKYVHSKSSGTGCDNDVKHDLCIIVSHPHGCSKTVTVGKWTQKHQVRKDNFGNEEVKYSYDTPTCPGSSGSPVIILEDDIKLQCGLSPLPPHSEGGPGNDNSSGVIVEQAS